MLGGDRNQDSYYNCYARLILQKEPIETTFELLNIYTPFTFSPNKQFWDEYLSAIERYGKQEYLPKMFTDLEMTTWAVIKHDDRIEFTLKIGESNENFESKLLTTRWCL